MRPLRRLAGNLALAFASAMALLALLETATRLFARVGPTLIVKDRVVGKRYVPGFAGDVYVPEAGRAVHLRFTRDGFRGPDRPEAAPAGVRRVAVIGDSMTVAVATDEERTFVRGLEERLGAGWETLNFGVSSARTGQELVYYREVARRFQPEVVVCAFYVGNDLADNSVRMTRAPRLYFDLGPGDLLQLRSLGPRASFAADWLDRHSRFYVWQKTRFAALRARGRALRGTLDVGHRIFETAIDDDLAHAWRLTERLLAAFADETRAGGARFVLAIVPCAEQVEDDVWGELLARAGGRAVDREQPERRLLEIAGRHGLTAVPMADEFRRAAARARAEGRDADLFLNHRHHLNDAGHALVAELLYRAIGRSAPSSLGS
jgi:hypothetical protein